MKADDYIQRLEHTGITNAGQETLWLMSYALSRPHSYILSRKEFSPEEHAKIEAVISRREAGEPLQYIIGEAEFYGRDFCVGSGVLIPRHDTETLIDAVKKCIAPEESFAFVDWGTGSGCIAVTLLLEFPNAYAYMIDDSPEALKYAEENISRYDLQARTAVNQLPECCRVIISNPPYIPSREIEGLMREVRDYEPITALDGGNDGMKFYREIYSLGIRILEPQGYIILETGNIQQVNSLKVFDDDFIFTGEVFDDGNFPRALIFRRRN